MTATALTSLPDQFGQARVAFGTSDWRPNRRGSTLFFPFRLDQVDIYPLQNGEQFLLVPKDGWGWQIGPYFGGTDERPFVTEVARHYAETFLRDGEDAFYEALVPPVIKILQERIGGQLRRQGDIFALPLPLSWTEMCAEYRRHKASGKRRMVTGSGATRVLGTRHQLSGCWAKREPVFRHGGQLVNVYTRVVQGTLSAPDHADLVLHGPHAIARNMDVGFEAGGD